ncbi:Ubiquitin carboxyl-terminal hydrolase 16 [Amphibalanus amphitrite]|uniref:ubiquitinyl hydrolase 1 n=1 Tax=Amphibalanus amphitrite TaxID=1232801 RepID=A0A6A4W3I4_AMPAM|nr:Ubiquitin carboxyl-terminal hydrolase 16 [Amphibalanus amphitrite]
MHGAAQQHSHCNATKQLLIYSPPPVLTIHLKRFEMSSSGLRKVNRQVQFGERFDLAPFCSSISQDLPQMRAGQRGGGCSARCPALSRLTTLKTS